ncbi:KilA-N domain-containing protein [Aeromonas veronii]|uniref:KilA-N domain-containing protein n=1 Tax=Aeromonas veronii TaxID=654 RepID=UPI003F79D373
MKIKFNNKDYSIRQNEDGLYSLTDIEKAWLAEGGTGGQLGNWKRTPDVLSMISSCEIHILNNHGGSISDRGSWGCKRAVILFASYCSIKFQIAVVDALIAVSEGEPFKAAAIAESIVVSSELLDKYEKTRNELNDTIKECGGSMGRHAFSNYHRLVCKGATGYVPSVLTGKNGSTKDYLTEAESPEGLTAVIASMDTVKTGLKVGLDYHQIAAMLHVETTKNTNYLA